MEGHAKSLVGRRKEKEPESTQPAPVNFPQLTGGFKDKEETHTGAAHILPALKWQFIHHFLHRLMPIKVDRAGQQFNIKQPGGGQTARQKASSPDLA